MDHAPGSTAQRNNFLALPRTRAVRPHAHSLIDFVGGERTYGFYQALPNAITMLGRQVDNHLHEQFVILPCTL